MSTYFFPQGGLSGKIRDATTNYPISDVTIYITDDITTINQSDSTTDGRFYFTADIGDWDLYLVKSGYRTRRIPVTIESFRYPVRVFKMYKTKIS